MHSCGSYSTLNDPLFIPCFTAVLESTRVDAADDDVTRAPVGAHETPIIEYEPRPMHILELRESGDVTGVSGGPAAAATKLLQNYKGVLMIFVILLSLICSFR